MTNATRLDTLTLVPPARLGRLLSDARAARGASWAELAAATDGRFDEPALRAIEAGTRSLLDAEVEALVAAYGIDASAPPPRRTRLVVDIEEGLVRLVVEGDRRPAPANRSHPAVDVLSRYLGLICTLRGVRPGTTLALRQADLDVLAEVLGLDHATVEERLVKLMTNPGDVVGRRARRFERRLIVPAAGILVAATALGALVLEGRHHEPPGAAETVPGQLGTVIPLGARGGPAPGAPLDEIGLIPAAVAGR